jgi:peptide/nickel transport system substrate-binding protein
MSLPRRTKRLGRTALVASACVAALVVSACSSGGGSSGSASGGGHAITIAVSTQPTSLDPCDTQGVATSIILHRNVVEALTTIDAKTGKVDPLLATSWEQQNPTTWIFHLRTGVTFQDGTPFNADAAVYGLKRTQNAKLACTNDELLSQPVTATAVNASTLKLVTATPDPILPVELNYIDMMSTKTPMNAKTSDPIGTGPYKFAGQESGLSVSLAAYSGYWGTKPQITSATYEIRTDDAVRAATVKTGEAQIAVPVALSDTSGLKTVRYSQDSVMFLRLPTTQAPMNDVRVREAVAYAINKQQIISQLMGVDGAPADQIVLPFINGYIPNFTGFSYDPAKAKQLIAEAKASGVPVNTQISLVNWEFFAGAGEVVQAIAADLQAVGLNVKIDSMEEGAWLNYLHDKGSNLEILAALHDNESGDASFSFGRYMSSTGCCSAVHDPKVDSLLTQAAAASGTQRASLYQQAAQISYMQDVAEVPIAQVFTQLAVASNIQYTPNSLTQVELLLSDIRFTSSGS